MAQRFLIAIGVIASLIAVLHAAAVPAASPNPEAKAEPFFGGMGMGMGMGMYLPLLLSSMYGYGMYGLGGLGMMGMYGLGGYGLGFGLLW